MSFSFRCPVCRNVREAADHVFGKRVRCADCDNFVNVDESTIVRPEENLGLANELIPEDAVQPVANGAQVQDFAVAQSEFDLEQSTSPGPAGQGSGGSNVQGNPSQPNKKQKSKMKSSPKKKENASRESWKEEGGSAPVGPGGDAWTDGQDDGDGFEAVSLPKSEKSDDDDMDMTPMVDVTFLLLIFFMVTASFTLQKSMDLPTKTQDEPSPNVVEDFEDNPEYVSVFVSPYNEYRVRTSEYDWEDAPNQHELRVRLTDALQAQSKPEKLLIMAHADCFHDKVIQAMDIGIELNYKIQVIMTEEEF